MQTTDRNRAELLLKVVAEMLADYALMFGDKVESKDLKTQEEKYVMAFVKFTGKVTGEIKIATTRPFCWVLSANILGIEIDDEDAVKNESDSLKEFANIACGHFITAAFGKEIQVYIKPPVFRDADAREWLEISERSGGGFVIDGEPITASVNMEGEQ